MSNNIIGQFTIMEFLYYNVCQKNYKLLSICNEFYHAWQQV